MILYRGTWSPEKQPAPRAYVCVFFTLDFAYAVDFAAWEQSGHDRGFGYVQRYRLPKQNLLDRHTKQAVDLAQEYSPGEIPEDWHLMLFWDPPGSWVDFLIDKGFTGTKTGPDICIFDVSKAVLTGRWHVSDVSWNSKKRRLQWKAKKLTL